MCTECLFLQQEARQQLQKQENAVKTQLKPAKTTDRNGLLPGPPAQPMQPRPSSPVRGTSNSLLPGNTFCPFWLQSIVHLKCLQGSSISTGKKSCPAARIASDQASRAWTRLACLSSHSASFLGAGSQVSYRASTESPVVVPGSMLHATPFVQPPQLKTGTLEQVTKAEVILVYAVPLHLMSVPPSYVCCLDNIAFF